MSEAHTVTHEQQRAVYDALGLDPDRFHDTAAITVLPHVISVVRYRRNDEGQRYAVGGDIATDTTVLDVVRS